MNISMTGISLLWVVVAMITFILGFIFIMRSIYARRALKGSPYRRKGVSAESMISDRNKYANANVFRLSRTFFNMGLALSLAFTIMAFNWTQYERDVYIPDQVWVMDEDIEIEPPRIIDPPQPVLPPPPSLIEEVLNEEILEEELDFFDQSIEEESPVIPVVIEKKPPPAHPLPPPTEQVEPEIVEIFRVVEEMPRFPGCEGMESTTEKKQCADRKMLEFIYQNIKYPAIARENGVEGTVVITFVVEKNGEVTDAQIIRDIGAQCGHEALRVVNLMNEQGLKWTPGKQRGLPVRVQFNLPVRFRLE